MAIKFFLAMSDVELISQCILFFFAGYETTATTLSLAAYNIACNPDVQQKLYEEAKTVFHSKVIIAFLNTYKHKLNYFQLIGRYRLRFNTKIRIFRCSHFRDT